MVFKAQCSLTDKSVAIKYISLEKFDTMNMINLCREFKINQQLSQIKDNIYTARMIDHYLPVEASLSDAKSLNSIYMVFEYIPYTLDRVLMSKNALS